LGVAVKKQEKKDRKNGGKAGFRRAVTAPISFLAKMKK
jgi:hypothetical protein